MTRTTDEGSPKVGARIWRLVREVRDRSNLHAIETEYRKRDEEANGLRIGDGSAVRGYANAPLSEKFEPWEIIGSTRVSWIVASDRTVSWMRENGRTPDPTSRLARKIPRRDLPWRATASNYHGSRVAEFYTDDGKEAAIWRDLYGRAVVEAVERAEGGDLDAILSLLLSRRLLSPEVPLPSEAARARREKSSPPVPPVR